jgi:hypothetical protein
MIEFSALEQNYLEVRGVWTFGVVLKEEPVDQVEVPKLFGIIPNEVPKLLKMQNGRKK